jgi:hypothetical protein
MSKQVDHHELSCDVLVAGGGPAGVPCALAAARNGAKVILCQDRSVLGGNASSEVRMHIVGADHSGSRGVPLETEAREGGIIEEIRLENAVRNPQRAGSMMDLILYEKCRAEPNLRLMLNTTVVSAEVRDGTIESVKATRESTEDHFTIKAKLFVDCTGDGRLGAEAGAPYREGREANYEFDEGMGEKEPDKFRLGSTLLFEGRDMGKPMPFSAPPWARKFSEADLKFRGHGSWEYGYWWVEWGGNLDTIKDNERIRDDLLGIMLGIWDHVKNSGEHPKSENWAMTWFGFLPGKRESRRFVGMHVLRQSDLQEAVDHDDAIAFGGWPIDRHPPAGVDAVGEPPCEQIKVKYLFSIPLRSCMTEKVKNLLFAGRNISATHVAFASTRVMATCAVIGQGVGTAAALAVERGATPAALISDSRYVAHVQQRLLHDDCFVIGVRNTDEDDLARRAKVTASSQLKGGEAEWVQSGVTRAVHGEGGVKPGLVEAGSHRWMSDPKAGLPATLTLEWPGPAEVAEVRLVFDTGMNRPLTLTHQDSYVKRMVWGAQPETVKDYAVQWHDGDGKWQELTTVEGNYERLRVHRFEPVVAKAIRIEVRTTHGEDEVWRSHGLNHARICEVRCYGRVS